MYKCGDKFEFKNPRRKPKLLVQAHLVLQEKNLLITTYNLSGPS